MKLIRIIASECACRGGNSHRWKPAALAAAAQLAEPDMIAQVVYLRAELQEAVEERVGYPVDIYTEAPDGVQSIIVRGNVRASQ